MASEDQLLLEALRNKNRYWVTWGTWWNRGFQRFVCPDLQQTSLWSGINHLWEKSMERLTDSYSLQRWENVHPEMGRAARATLLPCPPPRAQWMRWNSWCSGLHTESQSQSRQRTLRYIHCSHHSGWDLNGLALTLVALCNLCVPWEMQQAW